MKQPEKETLLRAIGRHISETVASALVGFERRIATLEQRAPEKGDPGENGKDADVSVIEALRAEIAALREQIKPADDGAIRQIAMAAATEGIELALTAAREVFDRRPIPAGENGKDGRGITDALIDINGDLVLTFTDGATKTVGPVKGKDGKDGENGQSIKGDPGENGKHGKDGFGFEDMTEEVEDGGRTVIRRYTRGDEVKEFKLKTAHLIDRGIYRSGSAYAPGDAVTFGGSLFIAQRDTNSRPETDDSWRLAVKRGRDGKPGEKGKQGDPGKPGPPGLDRR